MGARGKQSNMIRRSPRVDTRPRSSSRGIVEGSPAYWDLVIGEQIYWSDPEDSERREAWEQWRERLLARWVEPGWRPAAWVTFDLPLLAERAGPWRRDMRALWQAEDGKRQIPLAEFVYALVDTSEDEREQIRDMWREWLSLAKGDRTHAIAEDVPPWFEAMEIAT